MECRTRGFGALALVPVLCMLPLTQAHAEEEAESRFKGKVNLGFVSSEGNTETQSLQTGLELSYLLTPYWTTSFKFESYSAEEDEETTAERYLFGLDNRWDVSERSFVFNENEYEDDRFSGFDFQFSFFAGYGYSWWETKRSFFETGLGVGFRRSQVEDTGENEDEVVGRFNLDYGYKLSDTAEFIQALNFDFGSVRNIFRSKSELVTKVTESVSLKIAFEVKVTDDVPEGTENSDRLTTISLAYTF